VTFAFFGVPTEIVEMKMAFGGRVEFGCQQLELHVPQDNWGQFREDDINRRLRARNTMSVCIILVDRHIPHLQRLLQRRYGFDEHIYDLVLSSVMATCVTNATPARNTAPYKNKQDDKEEKSY